MIFVLTAYQCLIISVKNVHFTVKIKANQHRALKPYQKTATPLKQAENGATFSIGAIYPTKYIINYKTDKYKNTDRENIGN